MAVTAKDVAEACGVSRITVNRALSGNENVKPETREKILKKAQEMGYVPNLIARSLVNGKSKMIGIVISDIKNLYFSEIVDAITRQARARGYMVCTCTHDSDCQEERRLIEMMKGYCVDGMILNCVNRGDEFKDWLDKLDMKYVILGYQLLPGSYTVGVNENKSVKDVVRFLKAHGYHKQVFVVPPLYGEDGQINIPHYQRASGFLEEAIAEEMEEFHVNLWLAPGMNIHRNPLCGRNYEYYSEDPYLTGMLAAAVTRGVQSKPGCGVTIKHFACNNQEDNRMGVDSRVSERALREIYLRGFEIAVKEGNPVSIMTSYNLVNGVHAANSKDLCVTVARKEWGFDGAIMSDWNTTVPEDGSTPWKCAAAGNDIIMPGNPDDDKNILQAYKEGKLTEEEIRSCAEHLITMISRVNQKR